MTLLSLPGELVLAIASHLSSLNDINNLSQTNRRCHAVLNGHLYAYSVSQADNAGFVWAAENGRLGIVQRFIDMGAMTVAKPVKTTMEKPLVQAARHGHHEIMALLLTHGTRLFDDANIRVCSQAAMEAALQNGHVEAIRVLIENNDNAVDLEHVYSRGNTALHIAALANQGAVIELLFNKGADLYGLGEYNTTAMHLAAAYGRADAVRALLDCGFDVGYVDRDGYGPLHSAAMAIARNGEITRTLLSHGADAYQVNGNGLMPLYLAVTLNKEDMVTELLDYGVDVDGLDASGKTPQFRPPQEHVEMLLGAIGHILREQDSYENAGSCTSCTTLCVAATLGYDSVARVLLTRGANPNITDPDGGKPLHLAVEHKHHGVATLLIEMGANLDAVDSMGLTPLDVASSHGGHRMVDLLLNSGVSLSSSSTGADSLPFRLLEYGHAWDSTLLPPHIVDLAEAESLGYRTGWQHYGEPSDELDSDTEWIGAEDHECGRAIKLFLDRGSNMESLDSLNRTLLHHAAFQNCESTVTLLLELGANPNSRDVFNQTPLHLALRDTFDDTVSILLDAGADADVRDINGETPLHIAARAGWKCAVSVLVQHGKANVMVRDKDGNTPLHLVMRIDCPRISVIVKHFLQAGADPHVRNDHGDSALDLARERGQEKIIALLSNVNGLSELDLDVDLDLEDWESSSSADFTSGRVDSSETGTDAAGMRRLIRRELRVGEMKRVVRRWISEEITRRRAEGGG